MNTEDIQSAAGRAELLNAHHQQRRNLAQAAAQHNPHSPQIPIGIIQQKFDEARKKAALIVKEAEEYAQQIREEIDAERAKIQELREQWEAANGQTVPSE